MGGGRGKADARARGPTSPCRTRALQRERAVQSAPSAADGSVEAALRVGAGAATSARAEAGAGDGDGARGAAVRFAGRRFAGWLSAVSFCKALPRPPELLAWPLRNCTVWPRANEADGGGTTATGASGERYGSKRERRVSAQAHPSKCKRICTCNESGRVLTECGAACSNRRSSWVQEVKCARGSHVLLSSPQPTHLTRYCTSPSAGSMCVCVEEGGEGGE